MAGLVYCCSLRDAVVVTPPDDLRTIGQIENALDGFPVLISVCAVHAMKART